PGALHLHHVGSQVGQDLPAEGAGEVQRELHHPDPLQRERDGGFRGRCTHPPAPAKRFSRCAASSSVSRFLQKAKRARVRPSAGFRKKEEPGTGATPASRARRREKVASSSGLSSRKSART